MRTQVSFHRRSNPKRLMYAGEIGPHVEQHNLHVVIDLLRERVGQTREAAHLHPHGEVLTLHKTRGDVTWIGIADSKLAIGAFLLGFLDLCPSRLRSVPGASFALRISHSFKTAFAADLPALASHFPHDPLNQGERDGFGRFNRLQDYPASILDWIKFCISACPLWHTHVPSVARIAGGVKL